MAAQYGIDDKGNSTQAIFFDYDNDGDLDLFILNHSTKRLKNFDVAYMKTAYDSLAGDKLYRNDGNNHFTDVTKQTGIISNPICFGLGVAVADFNGDGWYRICMFPMIMMRMIIYTSIKKMEHLKNLLAHI